MAALAALVSRRATAIVVTTVVMLAWAGCEGDIGAQARSDPSHFTNVTDHIDLPFVRKRLALFMPLPMLRQILPHLEQARFVLARVLARPALTPLFTELNNEVQARFRREVSSRLQRSLPGESRPSPTMAQLSAALPLLERLLTGMSDSLHEATCTST